MAEFSRLSATDLGRTERAVILFKPDGIPDFRKGVLSLSRALADHGFVFRLTLPTVTTLTPETARAFWPSDAVGMENHRLFMTGRHPEERAIAAPAISMIVEAASREQMDLIQTLRSATGPTNVEDKLGEMPEDSPEVELIRQSIRYQLRLGQGARLWPAPWNPLSPIYNVFHCSATPDEATLELALLYARNPEILAKAYSPEAVQLLMNSHNGLPDTVDTKLLLSGFSDPADMAQALAARFRNMFIDFADQDIMQLAYETSNLMPFLTSLDEAFAANLRGARPAGELVFPPLDLQQPASPLPVFIAVCGDMGSGKTSQLRALGQRGYKEVVQYTSRPMRPGEVQGVDYNFVSTGRMLDMIAQNRFAGVDRIETNLYGITHTQLHQANIFTGGRFAVVAGPNTIAGIREVLSGRSRFGAAFLDCTPEILADRLSARGLDSPEAMVRRLEWIKETKQWFAPRLPEFELVLDGDRTETAITQDIVSFAGSIASGQETRRTAPSTEFALTAKSRRIQWLFDQEVLPVVERMRTEIPAGVPAGQENTTVGITPLDAIEEKTGSMMGDQLTAFLEDLWREATQVQYLTPTAYRYINTIIQPHLLNVYSASRQVFSPWEQVRKDERRFGRLFEMGQTERAIGNLSRIKAAAEQIPEAERDLLVFMHDLGKVRRFNGHPLESADIVEQFNLTEYADCLDERSRAMDGLFIKYHQSVGDYAYGFASWMTAFVRMFQEPQALQLFRNADGSVNVGSVQAFLARHRWFTVCDVAGTINKWGGLVNVNTELYFSIIDRIETIFRENEASYDSAMAKLVGAGKESAKEQLAGMLLGFDNNADTWENGTTHYWDQVSKGVQSAVERGFFTERDWDKFMGEMPFIDNKYTPYFWWIHFGQNPVIGGEKVYDHTGDIPPASVFNSYVMISKIIKQAVPGFGPERTVSLVHFDRDGIEIAGRGKEIEAAWEGHRVFDRARSFKIENNIATFYDAEGKKIEGIQIVISHQNNESTLKFEYSNISFAGRDAGEF